MKSPIQQRMNATKSKPNCAAPNISQTTSSAVSLNSLSNSTASTYSTNSCRINWWQKLKVIQTRCGSRLASATKLSTTPTYSGSYSTACHLTWRPKSVKTTGFKWKKTHRIRWPTGAVHWTPKTKWAFRKYSRIWNKTLTSRWKTSLTLKTDTGKSLFPSKSTPSI